MARIDTIVLDVVIKEEPKYPVIVTKHPVERGAQITDHAHPELYTLSVEAIVSDLDGGDPSTALQKLVSLHGKPQPIRVEMPRGIYDPVVMTSWQPIYEARVGDGFHFRAEFIEWRVANTKLAAVKRLARPVKKGAAPQEKQQPIRKQRALHAAINGRAAGAPLGGIGGIPSAVAQPPRVP